MGNGPLPKSVKSQMTDGETVLWSHVSEKPVKLSNAYEQKPSPWRSKWLWPILYIIWIVAFLTWTNDHADMQAALVQIVPTALTVAAAIIAFRWMLRKYPSMGHIGIMLEPHGIYQNLVMTDRQLVAFNDPAQTIVIAREDVALVETDFENGGPALRIQSTSLKRDAVIIGLANFMVAKHQFYATT